MRRPAFIFVLVLVAISCTPPPHQTTPSSPPPLDRDTLKDFRTITDMRDGSFQSAAFLIDLRVNNDGEKYSVSTELYFSGDSVGFYGRGYLGKGAFRGQIINDSATILFNQQNEYFVGPVEDIKGREECASPGEVLLLVMSLLTGKKRIEISDDFFYPTAHEIKYRSGRFDVTARLDDKGFPKSEKLIDSLCGDSIVLEYYSFNRKFPFYKIQDALYYNGIFNFRARGFIREQKYNIDIKPRKFMVDIPADAIRLESL
jgi:hypothetical protein